jgi:hypothetical protein
LFRNSSSRYSPGIHFGGLEASGTSKNTLKKAHACFSCFRESLTARWSETRYIKVLVACTSTLRRVPLNCQSVPLTKPTYSYYKTNDSGLLVRAQSAHVAPQRAPRRLLRLPTACPEAFRTASVGPKHTLRKAEPPTAGGLYRSRVPQGASCGSRVPFRPHLGSQRAFLDINVGLDGSDFVKQTQQRRPLKVSERNSEKQCAEPFATRVCYGFHRVVPFSFFSCVPRVSLSGPKRHTTRRKVTPRTNIRTH